MSDSWTTEDALKGLCELEDVGDPRPIERPAEMLPAASQQGATPFVALTKPERKRLTQELADKLLILAHENPAAFLDGAGPQLNKFLDAASRLDEAPPDDLLMTKERMEAMTTHDIKEYIIRKANEQGSQPAAPPAAAVVNALLPLIPAERQGEAMAALHALQPSS
jgi:hypothetical protein